MPCSSQMTCSMAKRENETRVLVFVSKIGHFFSKTTHGYTHTKMEKATRDYSDRKKGKKPIAHLPELCPDLVTALAGLYVDDFTA